MIDFQTNIELKGNFRSEEVRLITVPKENLYMFFEFFDPDRKVYPIMIECNDGYVFVVLPRLETSETP